MVGGDVLTVSVAALAMPLSVKGTSWALPFLLKGRSVPRKSARLPANDLLNLA